MKTIILKLEKAILLTLLLSVGTASGQPTGALFNCNDAYAYWNIIRFSPNYGFINVSKPNGSAGIYLSKTDLSNMINIFFTENYDVKDMEIIDDTVFFCGQYVPDVSGFLGWFAINDLFFSPGSIHIDHTLSAYGLKELDNIEVFRDQSGKVHVAGYGLHDIIPNNQYYAFEAIGYPLSGMYYKTTYLYNTRLYDNVVDMAVTDNYVVYLECNRNIVCPSNKYGFGITLKAFQKNSMFSASYFPESYFETITSHYLYAGGCGHELNDNSDPHEGKAKMVHVGGDTVAVCSHRVDYDYSNWQPSGCDPSVDCGNGEEKVGYYLAHRVYDISPVQLSQPMVMTSAIVAQLPGINHIIDCFLYDRQNKTYIVQHRLETSPGVVQTSFTTFDFSLGGTPLYAVSDYQSVFNTMNVWLPENMCLLGGGGYLVSGLGYSDNSHFFWKSYFNNINGNCNVHSQYPIDAIPTFISKDNLVPIGASGTVLEFEEYFPTEIKENEVSIKCI